jgi:hypothetical protein
VGPLGDGGRAAGAAEEGAAGQREHGRQGVLAAVTAAGVGDLGKELEPTEVRARIHAMSLRGYPVNRWLSYILPLKVESGGWPQTVPNPYHSTSVCR